MMNTVTFYMMIIGLLIYIVHVAFLSAKIEIQKDKIHILDVEVEKYKDLSNLYRNLSNIDKIMQENIDLKVRNEDLRRLRTLDREARDRLIEEINVLKEYKSIINE